MKKFINFFAAFFIFCLCVLVTDNNEIDASNGKVHFGEWSRWMCMCDLGKKTRERSATHINGGITAQIDRKKLLQKSPCDRTSCSVCDPEQCPSAEPADISKLLVLKTFGKKMCGRKVP
ncbi:hypothetical protein HHUSO_G21721 [Huso huso]|uniref:Uncharacterized protein n=1 Tax=Huso huso TaxID=61971 RepID=A0ABR0YZQ6_HUSHU